MGRRMVKEIRDEFFGGGSWKNTLIAGMGTALILTLSVIAWLLVADRSNFNEKICGLESSVKSLTTKLDERDRRFQDKIDAHIQDTNRRMDFAFFLLTLDYKGRLPYLFPNHHLPEGAITGGPGDGKKAKDPPATRSTPYFQEDKKH